MSIWENIDLKQKRNDHLSDACETNSFFKLSVFAFTPKFTLYSDLNTMGKNKSEAWINGIIIFKNHFQRCESADMNMSLLPKSKIC